MKLFDVMHEGLRRAEACVSQPRDWRGSSRSVWQNLVDGFRNLLGRMERGDFGATLALVGLALVSATLAAAVLPVVLPLVLAVAVVAVLLLLARAWFREFATLMRLDDAAFPGRFDKLLWGLLLILVPPVGVWAFGAFRASYWGKTSGVATEPEV